MSYNFSPNFLLISTSGKPQRMKKKSIRWYHEDMF